MNKVNPMRICYLLSILAIAMATVGCGVFVKDFPELREYVLEPEREPIERTTRTNTSLMVRFFNVSPSYAKKTFIMRNGRRRTEDYYHQFAINPEEMVRENTIVWIHESDIFEEIIGTESILTPTHLLKGTVTAIYWDFEKPHRAILKMHFRLMDVRGEAPKVILSELYTAETPLESKSPENMVKAMEAALSDVLVKLEADIDGVIE